MKKLLIGLILLNATSYVLASGEELDKAGWFVGSGVGMVMLEVKPINQPQLASKKENTTLYTVFGGYNFTDWFGLEFDLSASTDFTDVNTGRDAYILGTSFTPKLSYSLNESLDVYLKAGFQYLAYEQTYGTYSNYDITWNGIDPILGAGLQFSFPSGVKARLDYKYSSLTLDRSENSLYSYDIYDEEIDLTFSSITFTLNYQF